MTNSLMEQPIEYKVGANAVKLSGNIIKNYLVRGNGNVSDQEVVMFLNLCKNNSLDPFSNDAYLVKFGNTPAQIITSKEAFMKRAESNQQYDGFEAGIVVQRDSEQIDIEGAIKLKEDLLIGGWAKVYRKDRKRPVSVRIGLDEFGKGQSTWKQMPLNMIRKTAIVNAMREAFPENVSGMYTEEESNTPIPVNDVQTEIDTNANAETLSFDEPEDAPAEEVQTEMLPKEEVEEKPATTTKSKFNDAELGF